MNERDRNEVFADDVETVVSYDSNIVKKIWWESIMPVFREYYYLIVDNLMLFVGVVLVSSSILNFDHSRYCDGLRSDNYACVNSATIYDYSTSTILLFVLGFLCITLWYVKRTTPIVYEE